MISTLLEEQLRYDKSSLEYYKYELAIADVNRIEAECKLLIKQLIEIWKQHPQVTNELLNITIGADGYYSAYALDQKRQYIIDLKDNIYRK